MAAKSEAQEEFDGILAKAERGEKASAHPADSNDYAHDRNDTGDVDEDTAHTQQRIDEAMRSPAPMGGGNSNLRLPPREFDHGRTTGVKGVIADARSFEEAARRFGRSLSVRGDDRRIGGKSSRAKKAAAEAEVARAKSDIDEDDDEAGSSGLSLSDDEGFLERWRLQRRLELQQKGSDIRTRRTSPSVRRYGRFDEVDALGYLDAIEKVARDTVVVVFVYDNEVCFPLLPLPQERYIHIFHSDDTLHILTTTQCEVSQLVSKALTPLVPKYSAVHFVRVHYEDIEFDNAGVPAILAYKNQGDLFANLTYVVDQLPADGPVDSRALESVLQKHQVL